MGGRFAFCAKRNRDGAGAVEETRRNVGAAGSHRVLVTRRPTNVTVLNWHTRGLTGCDKVLDSAARRRVFAEGQAGAASRSIWRERSGRGRPCCEVCTASGKESTGASALFEERARACLRLSSVCALVQNQLRPTCARGGEQAGPIHSNAAVDRALAPQGAARAQRAHLTRDGVERLRPRSRTQGSMIVFPGMQVRN